MKLQKCFLVCFLVLLFNKNHCSANNPDSTASIAHNNLGIGLGLTYGSIGGRIVFNPSEVIGLTLGLGYNLVGIGYNAGAIFSIPSKSNTVVYFSCMYGSNASIKIEGISELNKTYRGASFGAGIKLLSLGNPGNYWDIGLIIPVRSSQFKNDFEDIKNNSSIELHSDPWPVLINVGYNFVI